ncbi:hypothetical protein RRG08_051430 [Elysia crispata]|uniref:Uncharacterized protein n=1 Tax=Elysia crispata TaxID=231223 RepID=A0AAE1E9F6_9GAST|nr:hypothetical protein RRG08_051430 [Elysia crispata]
MSNLRRISQSWNIMLKSLKGSRQALGWAPPSTLHVIVTTTWESSQVVSHLHTAPHSLPHGPVMGDSGTVPWDTLRLLVTNGAGSGVPNYNIALQSLPKPRTCNYAKY